MQNISFKSFIIVSLTLFSMFFGAGNFIFPPSLGFQAGVNTSVAIIAFCLTAVLFPILGIAAVAKSNGLQNLASRVSYKFALVFIIAMLLIIGPLFAMPRAANMPYELAIKPFLGEFTSFLPLFIYSVVYFIINWALSINSTKMVDMLGKFLTPLLLLLIVVLVLAAIINPMHTGEFAAASGEWANHAVSKGVVEGYQTMDALAALNFGLVVLITFRKLGVNDEKSIVKYTILSGFVAGFILMTIYIALSYVGASIGASGLISEVNPNGATILSAATNALFGRFGIVILGVSVFLACLTTTVGLTCAISEYFVSITKIPYKTWIIIVSVFASIVANLGLSAIISYAVPFLFIIYPIALCLIVLSLLDDIVNGDRFTYVLTVGVVFVISLVRTFDTQFDINFPIVTELFKTYLPFYDGGFEWVIPAVVCAVIGSIRASTKR
ncbi:branched-chain amino acid transport system II carrier protein [Campylobacter corcagiensis]|uniref:Branched-chain amino acid transport system II carrier protein n=1 Tax=Campylobacter corcagiensis TaxID=1448857 RepID=A0A7M1LGX2_9BACT|nr:branched-chain amino acid transport system II carrier protein [Campylobacter corcagiensis]QKF64115.1 branched-chain amino acid transport system II carrier protein [Campylobacter corcagiensis]QOQ87690.1 branched-chain amino acid transport system II carrier protein [Campylobacter corcagiensis]